MKGIIFNLLEEFIIGNLGEDAYEDILKACDLRDNACYVGPGTYPDEDLMALVEDTVKMMDLGMAEGLYAFGRFSFPKLAKKYPLFVGPHEHPKTFIKSIDSVIHVEVKKLYKDADPPRLIYEDPGPDRLILKYRSGRRLCRLMEGLIDGIADYYGIPIMYEQKNCMLDGDASCDFHLNFAAPGGIAHEGRDAFEAA